MDFFTNLCGGCRGRDDTDEAGLPMRFRKGDDQRAFAKDLYRRQFPGKAMDQEIVSIWVMDRKTSRSIRGLARDRRGSCTLAMAGTKAKGEATKEGDAPPSMVLWSCDSGHSWWATTDEVRLSFTLACYTPPSLSNGLHDSDLLHLSHTLTAPSLKVRFGIWCPSCGNGAMSAELTLDVDTREIGAILKEAAFSVGFKEDMSHILNIRPDQVSKQCDIDVVRCLCYVYCVWRVYLCCVLRRASVLSHQFISLSVSSLFLYALHPLGDDILQPPLPPPFPNSHARSLSTRTHPRTISGAASARPPSNSISNPSTRSYAHRSMRCALGRTSPFSPPSRSTSGWA